MTSKEVAAGWSTVDAFATAVAEVEIIDLDAITDEVDAAGAVGATEEAMKQEVAVDGAGG